MGDPFDGVTSDAVLGAGCSESYAAEVLERLDSGRLSTLALAMLLLETPARGGWEVLRQALVRDLAQRTHEAAAVFNVATSALGLCNFARGVTGRSGPPHAPTFTAEVSVERDGEIHKANASASGVKLAEQRAAVLLLARFAEVPAPSFSEGDERRAILAPPPAKAAAPSLPTNGNPIGWLHEHAAKSHAKQPHFPELAMRGTLFAVGCRYQGQEVDGEGVTKQAAKTEAARRMVERLRAPTEAP